MKLKITKQNEYFYKVQRNNHRSVIINKWGVTGVTNLHKTLRSATIKLNWLEPEKFVVTMATAHELGHTGVWEDILNEESTPALGMETIRRGNKWHAEVEAWLRGIDNSYVVGLKPFEFILDCLNTYRRALRIDDELWDEARELLAEYYDGPREDIFNYVPVEPDPDEPPPSCTNIMHVEGDDDEADEKESEDTEEGDEDEEQKEQQGGERASDENATEDKNYDMRWMQQHVLDLLSDGATVEDLSIRLGLDPNALPPLAAAIVQNNETFPKEGS